MSYIVMVITLTLSIERHGKYSTVSLNDYMDANVLGQTHSVAENIGCLEAISALCTYVCFEDANVKECYWRYHLPYCPA